MNVSRVLLIFLFCLGVSLMISATVTIKALAKEYPMLINVQDLDSDPNIGDCWITISHEDPNDYQILIYTAAGWRQIYVRENGEMLFRNIEDTGN